MSEEDGAAPPDQQLQPIRIIIEISPAGMMNVFGPQGWPPEVVEMWLHRASAFLRTLMTTAAVEAMLKRRQETEMMRRMVEGR